MWDLLAALGLALVLEGVLYALFPAAMRRFMAEALKQPDSAIRIGALIMLFVGVGIVWLARS
jgi:uncharacterized protein